MLIYSLLLVGHLLLLHFYLRGWRRLLEGNGLDADLSSTMLVVVIKKRWTGAFATWRHLARRPCSLSLHLEGILETWRNFVDTVGRPGEIGQLSIGRKVEGAARFQQTVVHGQAELVAYGSFVNVRQRDSVRNSLVFAVGDFACIGSSGGLERRARGRRREAPARQRGYARGIGRVGTDDCDAFFFHFVVAVAVLSRRGRLPSNRRSNFCVDFGGATLESSWRYFGRFFRWNMLMCLTDSSQIIWHDR